MSISSALGGLAYGAVTWSRPERRRLPVLAGALAASIALAGLSPNVYVLAAAVAGTGLFTAPTITCAYLAANEAAAVESRTSAGVWVNNSYNAGSSGGTAGIALVIGRLPLASCFLLAAAPALVASAAALIGGRRRRADVSDCRPV